MKRFNADARVLVLEADERLNEFGSQALIERADRELGPGIEIVVVACSGLGFLGSAGVGNLLHLQKHLRDLGVEVRLAGLAADQIEVLRITRVHTMIEVFESVEDAAAVGE